ncbi:hypothetical protein N5D52_13905 [Pseudomonas sp. GD03860]|uniref:hypothetical protein n=1 Tax=Pseudomonas TaxID=286 RepID=UPI0023637064|nr:MULTISPECIES: hypothetical protein [Pseudomonas]MDD2056763.1 hypothetical protein [Pseudomonas putida]MDH0638041.1 hypothetical protein [Pseudomonas sp. GD03860]
MALYNVNAARRDKTGKLVALQGFETHGIEVAAAPAQVSPDPRAFSVDEVIGLIHEGDKFQLIFGSPLSWIGGGSIHLDGKGSLTEGSPQPGRRISDLPDF